MSELNRRLNELSQVKLSSATQKGSPLRAANIAPVPKSVWPKWAALGCCGLALSTVVWWFSQPESVVTPAMAETTVSADPIIQQPELVAQSTTVQSEATQPAIEQSDESKKHQPEVQPIAVASVEPAAAKKAAPVPPTARQVAQKSVSADLADMPVAQESLESEEEQKELQSSYDQGYESGYERALAEVKHEKKAKAVVHQAPAPAPVKSELSIQTVALTPNELAQVEYLNAEKALEQEDSKQAVMNLEAALNYRPNWIMARQRLAALYYGRGEVREAIATLEKGLAKQPNQPELRLTLAKLLVNESQNQAALAVLNDKSGSMNTQYLAMRGALAQKLNNNAVALNSYQQLVRVASFDGRWWMGLAIAQDRSGDMKKAVESYRKALQLGNISASSQQFIQQRLAALTKHRS
ncbi:tetratricopeptide repeat protein [Photobacterium leiognathi]|uniref:tetratricopeptide repeat protein n=1 Tax=Photobacterium leiognathi TaxID=553611 RepID=UPI002980BCE4|nr:tetratricopeptide repeat protein [Photobacterium leiognathi]